MSEQGESSGAAVEPGSAILGSLRKTFPVASRSQERSRSLEPVNLNGFNGTTAGSSPSAVVPSATVTLAYGDPTSTAAVGSVPLPDNAPTVSSVLVVALIAIFLAVALTYHWWKRALPPFVLCGCCPFIVVHSEHEDDIPDIVDLAFARLDAAGAAGPKEVRIHTTLEYYVKANVRVYA
ncbi:hypothetical protein F4604DRAFT_1672781 [Suillus subluteus]|nr:hypothetical protein F4604DRAFT_1672781 [Suillus subluteus]